MATIAQRSCLALGILLSLSIAGCGGGDDNTTAANNHPDVSTDDAIRAASSNMMRHLDTNVSGMSDVASRSNTANAALLSTFGENRARWLQPAKKDRSIQTRAALNGMMTRAQADDAVDDIQQLVDATMGLNGPQATVTREGDRITIDPDDEELCRSEVLGISDGLSTDELADCMRVASHITVVLDITSEDSGTLSYRYDERNVINIGYSPASGSYELDLAGLGYAVNAIASSEGLGEGVLPDTFDGAVKMVATTLNDVEGQEAGTVSFDISRDIRIADSNNSLDLSVAASRVVSMSSDLRNGTANLEWGMGALRLALAQDDEAGMQRMMELSLSALTGNININNNSDSVTVTNLGLGDSPMRLSVDSVDVMRVALQQFGFTLGSTLDDGEGEVAMTSALDFSIFVNNQDNGLLDTDLASGESTLSITAPSGTVLTPAGDEAVRISGGGPLSIYGTNGFENQFSVSAGECFTEVEDESEPLADDDQLNLEIVPCP